MCELLKEDYEQMACLVFTLRYRCTRKIMLPDEKLPIKKDTLFLKALPHIPK